MANEHGQVDSLLDRKDIMPTIYFIEANGQSTSTFISPHLFDLRSRIWIKNRFISLNEIKKYEKRISRLNVKLSLFEVLTLIYILAVSQKKKLITTFWRRA